MPDYYFDIETVPFAQYRGDPSASLWPEKAKIISLQFQELDRATGNAVGRLVVLKEWEKGSSELFIVKTFKNLYLDRGPWHFVPIGNNLLFEFKFMKYKLKQYFGLDGLKLGQQPNIDLKHVMVLINGGSFKGYGKLLGKSGLAANMADWYYSKNWPAIEQYIMKEASDFVKAYSVLKQDLPKLGARLS